MVDRLSSDLLLASVAEFIKSRDDIWNKVPFRNYSAVCTFLINYAKLDFLGKVSYLRSTTNAVVLLLIIIFLRKIIIKSWLH